MVLEPKPTYDQRGLRPAAAAEKDTLVVERSLGAHLFDRYVDAKTREWDDYRLYVSEWELDRYLPVY